MNLIGGDCVKAAAKGIQLDQIQTVTGFNIGSRPVQPGVVHPLISYNKRPFHLAQVTDRVLCENCKSVRGDKLRNAVVNLRIHMVGTSGKNNAVPVMLLQPCNGFLALFLHIPAAGQKLLPACMSSLLNFNGRNLIFPAEFYNQLLCQNLFTGKGKERIHKANMVFRQLLHIVFDVFCVRGNHGAVVMVSCIRSFIPLIGDAGIKNVLNTLLNQPGNMTMNQLCRIALGLAGNRFDTQFVQLSGGLRGKKDGEAQLFEKYSPEGEILIHIQNSGNTNHAAGSLISCKRLVAKYTAEFVVEEVGNLFF